MSCKTSAPASRQQIPAIPLMRRRKFFDRRLSAGREDFFFDHARQGIPDAQVVLQRVLLDLIDGAFTDAASGRIDDAQDG